MYDAKIKKVIVYLLVSTILFLTVFIGYSYPKGYDIVSCHGFFSIVNVNQDKRDSLRGSFYVTSQKGGASVDVIGEYSSGEKLYRIDRTIILNILPQKKYGNTMISEPKESHHNTDTYDLDISPFLFGINEKGFTALYSKRVKEGVYIFGDSYSPRFICSHF